MLKKLATDIARIAAGLLLVGGTAFAQTAPDANAGAKTTVRLTTVPMALPAGAPWLTVEQLFCNGAGTVTRAMGGRAPQDLPPYTAVFRTELEQAGFQVVAEDNLFGQETGAADYQVAAVITDAHVDACIAHRNIWNSAKDGDVSGNGAMKVDWQVFSPLKKEVVAHVSTDGDIKLDKPASDGLAQLITGAFASNARALAANAEFRTAMNAPKPAPDALLPSAKNSSIALSGSLKAAKLPIADAVGSVVTLLTGSGSGSGVLVSDDGYLITDAHVVGDEKEIRARWSDGIETVAQVIRVAKDRDVALVKTNPRERSPLPIKRGAVTPGQRVFAIGSPNGEKFQGTVSSGVVSATRIVDGLRYIQSDVSVSFGSSGGPLLDEDGAVIGFTDLGITNHGQPAGLNLFTPIGDAMDFLNLEQK